MNIIINPIIKTFNISLGKPQNRIIFGQKNDSFEKTPVISSVEEITEITGNRDNELGRGYYHIVYKIPKQPDYVLRVPLKFNPNKYQNAELSISESEDKSLKFNAGQKMAVITLKNDNSKGKVNLEILKKQKGIPLGVMPYSVYDKAKKTIDVPDYDSKEMKEKHEKSLEIISSFPLSSYEKLIENIQKARKSNYSFDYFNSNNILYDEASQSLNLIDLEFGGKKKISYGSILFALTDSAYLKTYNTQGYDVGEEARNKTGENVSTITDKFMAALKNKCPDIDAEEALEDYFTLYMTSIL